jgi:adenylate cyclase
MRLNPRDRVFPSWITVSYYYDADYDRAVKMANTLIERYPDYPIMYKWLAAALGQLGRHDEARAALRHAIKFSPKSFELLVRSRLPYFRPEDYEHMLDGLRKAGWQE